METKEEPDCSFHGVLRYRRESECRKMNPLPPSASDHTVWCEFCGAKAKPQLDFSKTTNPEDFCCAQYMEMFRKLEQQWHSLHENSDESSQENNSNTEKVQDNRDKARSQDVLQQVAEECLRKSKRQPSENPETEMPGCKVTSSGLFTIINFRLSDFVRFKKKEHSAAREENPGAFKLCSTNSSARAGFGLSHIQGHSQKLYSNGTKFLTGFPDGTVRVFYPSGNLAIISFIDDTEGVCIVLDDTRTNCPIRACFQSSGLATCYHSNRNTWLHMDESGGLIQNEDGSTRRKWKWTEQTNKPTPFKPVHMSLNKHIGVRVRRRESVVVTFLASGQQTRISVGTHAKPSVPMTPLCKEELMLQVSQLSARLAVERLRLCLTTHSYTKHRPLRLPRALVSEKQRLLRLSSSVCMEEKETAYIQQCLLHYYTGHETLAYSLVPFPVRPIDAEWLSRHKLPVYGGRGYVCEYVAIKQDNFLSSLPRKQRLSCSLGFREVFKTAAASRWWQSRESAWRTRSTARTSRSGATSSRRSLTRRTKSQWDRGSWRSLSSSCAGQPYSRSSRASEWECNTHGSTASPFSTFNSLLLRNKKEFLTV